MHELSRTDWSGGGESASDRLLPASPYRHELPRAEKKKQRHKKHAELGRSLQLRLNHTAKPKLLIIKSILTGAHKAFSRVVYGPGAAGVANQRDLAEAKLTPWWVVLRGMGGDRNSVPPHISVALRNHRTRDNGISIARRCAVKLSGA